MTDSQKIEQQFAAIAAYLEQIRQEIDGQKTSLQPELPPIRVQDPSGVRVALGTALEDLQVSVEELLATCQKLERERSRYQELLSQRQQAELALEYQREQERAIEEIAQSIRQSLDLAQILQAAVERVREFLQSDRAFIYRFQPDWSGTIVVESVAEGWPSVLHHAVQDTYFQETQGEDYRQGRIQAIADLDTAELTDCHRQLLAQFQVRANLVVPILLGETLWGLLVANQCGAPRQWQPREITLLRKLATQLGIGIQQAELYQRSQQELQERQRAEAALQKLNQQLDQLVQQRTRELQFSEERYRLALELTQTGSWDWDLSTGELTWNDHHFSLLGLEPREAKASYQTWRERVHPQDRDRVELALARSLASQAAYEAEYRVIYPDGAVHWLMARGKGLAGAGGRTVRMLGVVIDIDARKQVQLKLEQQLAQERLLAEITHHVRQSLNLEQILATAVRETYQFLQADRVLVFRLTAEGMGVVIEECVNPDYPATQEMFWPDECFPEECYQYYCQGQPRIVSDVAADEWAACLAEFMAEVGVKSKIVAPIVQAGEGGVSGLWGLLIVHACSYPRLWQPEEAQLLQQLANQLAIAVQQGELYQQLQQELRERERVENSLRQSETLFRSLSESAPVGIFKLDATGHSVYTNQKAQEICGYTAEEAMGSGWMQFVAPEDLQALLPQWKVARETQADFTADIRYCHRDGSERWGRVKVAPILPASQERLGYVGTIEDITQSRQIEQVKSEFISVVSHELRTPLTALQGSLALLAAGVLDSHSEKARQMLDIAALESERLVRLVNDILDLERLETKTVKFRREWWDAVNLSQQAIEAMRSFARENQVELESSLEPGRIWGDRDRIVQTLLNLLSNAIKFSPPGSTVTVAVEFWEREVRFQVRDRGRGIPPDKLEAIFDRFQQVDASDSRKQGGTGLGLAICRKIVESHGGRLWVESVLGQGSTFFFTLPLPPEPTATVEKSS